MGSISNIWQPEGTLPNKHVPNANQYYPLSEPAVGTPLSANDFPQNATLPKLFEPLTIRGVTFKNRIFVSPMCQYSSDNGHTTDWHLVHIGGFATRGAGGICMEASAVVPEGRITPEDNGIWDDSHIPGLKRIVDFVHAQGTKIGIQLGHAGRKASTRAPWVQLTVDGKNRDEKSSVATVEEGGWPEGVYSASDIPYTATYPKPKALSESQIDAVVEAFAQAVKRAEAAGFDFIEIHGAHGYLIHSFVSPLSNNRTDSYGGSLENRLRLPLLLAKRVREIWSKPLFYRLSATDWAEGPEKDEQGAWLQWGNEQSAILSQKLKDEADVDLIDASSGGLWEKQKIPIGPGYQVPGANFIKTHVPSVLVGAVGLITGAKQAEAYLKEGAADVVFLARELLRDVDFPLRAAQELGVAVKPVNQYERAWSRMLQKH